MACLLVVSMSPTHGPSGPHLRWGSRGGGRPHPQDTVLGVGTGSLQTGMEATLSVRLGGGRRDSNCDQVSWCPVRPRDPPPSLSGTTHPRGASEYELGLQVGPLLACEVAQVTTGRGWDGRP